MKALARPSEQEAPDGKEMAKATDLVVREAPSADAAPAATAAPSSLSLRDPAIADGLRAAVAAGKKVENS